MFLSHSNILLETDEIIVGRECKIYSELYLRNTFFLLSLNRIAKCNIRLTRFIEIIRTLVLLIKLIIVVPLWPNTTKDIKLKHYEKLFIGLVALVGQPLLTIPENLSIPQFLYLKKGFVDHCLTFAHCLSLLISVKCFVDQCFSLDKIWEVYVTNKNVVINLVLMTRFWNNYHQVRPKS
jgi:hypothetical protein